MNKVPLAIIVKVYFNWKKLSVTHSWLKWFYIDDEEDHDNHNQTQPPNIHYNYKYLAAYNIF